ncbi:MAG TPA: hypothetical protein VEZ72_17035 [Paenibacillus sp.]|nr:hypothetical protein [Paenibacillus sp.]
MNWNAWPLERWSILFVAISFLLIGVQVFLFHYRQNFHNKAMWTPVIEAPIVFISGIVFVMYRTDAAATVWVWLMYIAVVSGFVGFYYHTRGLGKRVGGYELRNFLIGPPTLLPLMLSALGAFGLLAVYAK